MINQALTSMAIAAIVATPIFGDIPAFFSVGSASNGTIRLCIGPSQNIGSAVAVDPAQRKYRFVRDHQIWTAVIPVVDYLPGTYEFPIQIEEAEVKKMASITVNIIEGDEFWNFKQKEINDIAFDIALLLQKTRPSSNIEQSPVYGDWDEYKAVFKTQQKLIAALASKLDTHSIINRNGSVFEGEMENLYANLGSTETRLDETRQALLRQSNLVKLLTKHQGKSVRQIPKKDITAIQSAYLEFFSKRYSFTPLDKETTLIAIKFQSSQLYEQKLELLKQRDTLLRNISEALRLYPNIVPPTAYSSSTASNSIAISHRYEWTTLDEITQRLIQFKNQLTDPQTPQMTWELENQHLKILDLKNGRADFIDRWPTESTTVNPDDRDIDRLDAQLDVALSNFKERQSIESIKRLDRQHHDIDERLKAKETQNTELATLLDELNEAIKKKISEGIHFRNAD